MMDVDSYCRDIEAHLCRRNAGHLVRISGPAFDLVRGWAQRGIPFTVAQQGIDRYIDRSNARGLRRRPARIEFCEADVLDAFDAWRRAVGIHRAEAEASEAEGVQMISASVNVPTQDIEDLLIKVKNQKFKPQEADAFWDEAVEKHGNPPLKPDMISYEQAKRLGLTPSQTKPFKPSKK